MSEPVDPLIGQTVVGTYVIRSKLAEGGMGCIYVAVNQHGNRKVVKTLLPHASMIAQIRERFDREGRLAAGLNGRPHIVKIDDVGTLPNGQQFLTMEYLHGQTLEAHMHKHGRVSPYHAFMLVVQIARGLHELHSAKIVHRDLKPGNVFLERDHRNDHPYHVVLIDLGIAHDATLIERDPNLKTQEGAAMGTPGYMAPEQYGDAGRVTPSADVYALAIILYELLVGVRPWDAPSIHMVYHLQQTQPPTIPDGIAMPENWRAIILRALAKQPEARWQSAYEFASALASELPGDPRLGLQSGAQMMVSFARSLINQAPLDSETIRVKGAALGPMMWTPPRLTDISNESAPAAGRAPHISAPRVASNPAASELPPTVNERPAPNVAPPTTFSASSGAIVQPAPPKGRHKLMLPISLIATVLVATGVTIGAARLIRSASSNDVAIDATAVVPDADKLAHAAPPDAMEVAADAPSDAAEVAVVDASVIVDASIPSDARVIEGTKVAKDGSKSTTPAVRGTGKLAVYVTPWAVVWLDGKKLAQTPLDPMVVTAGRHRIRLVNEDAGKDESFTITITAEQTTTIRRAW